MMYICIRNCNIIRPRTQFLQKDETVFHFKAMSQYEGGGKNLQLVRVRVNCFEG